MPSGVTAVSWTELERLIAEGQGNESERMNECIQKITELKKKYKTLYDGLKARELAESQLGWWKRWQLRNNAERSRQIREEDLAFVRVIVDLDEIKIKLQAELAKRGPETATSG